jgi:hypothetical protein
MQCTTYFVIVYDIFMCLIEQNIFEFKHIVEGETEKDFKLEIDGTACFKKCKQLLEYQHLLLLRDIWLSMF